MAMQLHCSRRQLQRVLKKLLEEGQLVKLRKVLTASAENAIASLFPRFQDRCSDRSLRHFYAEVLCNGCADHSEGVLRLLRPLSFIDGEYARSGTCSLVWSVPV